MIGNGFAYTTYLLSAFDFSYVNAPPFVTEAKNG